MNERVRHILSVELAMPAHEIDEKLSAEDASNWDSIRTLNVALALEEEFGVAFSADEMIQLTSYRAIADALAERGIS